MSISYNTATISDRLAAVVNNIDAGSSHGVLSLGTAGMGAVIANITLPKPCGVVAGNLLTFTAPDSNLTLIAGTLGAAQLQDSAGTVVASGLTIGNSTAYDIIIVDTLVSAGVVLTLTSATITGT